MNYLGLAKQNDPLRQARDLRTVKKISEPSEKIIRMLLPRLERISVDSYWAHRASGVRGALTKILDDMEMGQTIDPESVRTNLLIGFEILKEAAEEYL